jgi:hypothetical protein
MSSGTALTPARCIAECLFNGHRQAERQTDKQRVIFAQDRQEDEAAASSGSAVKLA